MLIVFVRAIQFYLGGLAYWLMRQAENEELSRRDRWLLTWAENYRIQMGHNDNMGWDNMIDGDLFNELEEGEIFEGLYHDVWWQEENVDDEWTFWYNDPEGYNAEVAGLFSDEDASEYGEDFDGENWISGESWDNDIAQAELDGIIEYNFGDWYAWQWRMAMAFYGHGAMAA